MGAPTGSGLYDSARELTEMASMQFAVYGLMNPYTYQRPKITPLPNETGLTVPGGTGVAVVPNGTAPALKQPYLPGQYTEYPAAVQGWAQQALPGGGSGIESGSKSISQVDRIKIDAWDYTPGDELYLKYKDVFDNPKYYNQETGAINWPENNGFADIPMDEVLQPGARIDRYGSDYGSFTSPEGTPYAMRAVAPETDQRPYSVYEVVEPINVKSGSIASWFDEPDGGIQYLLPDTVDELLDAGILRKIQ